MFHHAHRGVIFGLQLFYLIILVSVLADSSRKMDNLQWTIVSGLTIATFMPIKNLAAFVVAAGVALVVMITGFTNNNTAFMCLGTLALLASSSKLELATPILHAQRVAGSKTDKTFENEN